MSADNYWAVVPDGENFAVVMGFESNDEWPKPKKDSARYPTATQALEGAHIIEEMHWSEYGVRLHPDVRAALGIEDKPRNDLYNQGYDAAVRVFTEKFFGGPTKDMVLAWFEEARRTSSDAGNVSGFPTGSPGGNGSGFPNSSPDAGDES